MIEARDDMIPDAGIVLYDTTSTLNSMEDGIDYVINDLSSATSFLSGGAVHFHLSKIDFVKMSRAELLKDVVAECIEFDSAIDEVKVTYNLIVGTSLCHDDRMYHVLPLVSTVISWFYNRELFAYPTCVVSWEDMFCFGLGTGYLSVNAGFGIWLIGLILMTRETILYPLYHITIGLLIEGILHLAKKIA